MAEQETHASELAKALELEAEGQRRLLSGDEAGAAPFLRKAADHYKRSWQLASPTSYGRLIGMTKAAVLAGEGEEQGRFARAELANVSEITPAAAYALALGALAVGDDEAALPLVDTIALGGPPFARAAAAIGAICRSDRDALEKVLAEIVADFESRPAHLTGVPIADTALMFARLAARRGLAVRLEGRAVGMAG